MSCADNSCRRNPLILDSSQLEPTSQAITQLPRYMSYPDRLAVARDALLHLMKDLQKILQEGIQAVLVCPHWPTVLWWLETSATVIVIVISILCFSSTCLYLVLDY